MRATGVRTAVARATGAGARDEQQRGAGVESNCVGHAVISCIAHERMMRNRTHSRHSTATSPRERSGLVESPELWTRITRIGANRLLVSTVVFHGIDEAIEFRVRAEVEQHTDLVDGRPEVADELWSGGYCETLGGLAFDDHPV